MSRFNDLTEDDQVRRMDGASKLVVDPRFDVAASRMHEPSSGWPVASPPRLGTAPQSIHRRPLEVEPGFLVSDVKSIADCDLARSILVDAILSIEGQLDGALTRHRNGGTKLDLEWQRKARGALRAKQVAFAEVETIRKRLTHEGRSDRAVNADKALLEVIRELDPVLYADATTTARERGLIS